jgi:energy-coupling factor transporter ATP-binding protein EcfA2
MLHPPYNLEIVKTICRRTLVLDEEKVIADGPTEDILSDIPLLEAQGLAPPREV